MRRRALFASVAAGAATALAGCSGLRSGQQQSVQPAADDWTTESTERGEVTVESGDSLQFRVFKCNTALARADLGELSGTLRVAFDYRVEAEGYWESTVLRVREGDSAVDLSGDTRIEKKAYGTATGRVDATADLSGPATLVVGLEPSDYCSNGDHGTTRFAVESLTVEVE